MQGNLTKPHTYKGIGGCNGPLSLELFDRTWTSRQENGFGYPKRCFIWVRLKSIPYESPSFIIKPNNTLTNEVVNEGLDGVACHVRVGGRFSRTEP